MLKRSPKSVDEKLEVVFLYLGQGKSISTLIKMFRVSDETIRNWSCKYKKDCVEDFKESQG
jgi:ISSth1 transposase